MKYRILGRTNLRVSEIGFGAWGIGGSLKLGEQGLSYGQTNNDESLRALRVAINNGINFFDTADFYGLGLSERLIGQAIKGKREKMIIATKVGNVASGAQGVKTDLSYHHIMAACERSLARLQTDYIDVYQLHFPPESPTDECFEALKKLKKDGKVRFIGVSIAHAFDKAKKFIESGAVDTLLLYYNLLFRDAEKFVLPQAQKYNVGVIVASPLSRGILTGKYNTDTNFPAEDVRSKWNKGGKDRNWFLEQLKKINEIEKELSIENQDLVDLAFCFALNHPAISTIIPGMKTKEQVSRNLRAYDRSSALKEKIRRLILLS